MLKNTCVVLLWHIVNGLPHLSSDFIVADVQDISSTSELTPRLEKAVTMSGGGSRAFSCATGGFRALDSMGLMQSVDGLSSVSGGTWASSVYMFAPESFSDEQ